MNSFISICESEALQLHALMMSGINPFVLLKPNTLSVIDAVWRFRKETALPVCFTLDAGPNVHLLYPQGHKTEIQNWIERDLRQYCDEGKYIEDRVGSGPAKVD
jgi:diphosphomevalonate decarboxylase